MIRLHASFEALPHALEKLLETLSILRTVKQRTIDAREPHLSTDGFQELAISAETDGDVLVFLAIPCYQLRASECRQLRCCDPKTTLLITTKENLCDLMYQRTLTQVFPSASSRRAFLSTRHPCWLCARCTMAYLNKHQPIGLVLRVPPWQRHWRRLFCPVGDLNDNALVNILSSKWSIKLTEICCRLLNVRFADSREPQQPQNSVGNGFQDVHPRLKRKRIDFVKLVEVTVDDCVIGQAVLSSCRHNNSLWNFFSSGSFGIGIRLQAVLNHNTIQRCLQQT